MDTSVGPDAEADGGLSDSGQIDGGPDAGQDGGADTGVIDARLTVEGTATSGFTVEVRVGAQVYSAVAGTDGRYRIDIPTDDGSTVAWIVARGPVNTRSEPIVLASVLDTVDRLVVQSGGDGVLDSVESRGNVLSAVTTARYGLLYQAHGGRLPQTRSELIAADRTAEELAAPSAIRIAAVLHQLFAVPSQLPSDATSTLDLARDGAMAQAVINALGDELLDTAIRSVAGNMRIFEPEWDPTDFNGDSYFSNLPRQRRDVVRTATGRRWDFLERPGEGVLRRRPSREGVLRPNMSFTWQDSGPVKNILYASSLDESVVNLGVDEVLAAGTSPALEARIREVFQSRATLPVTLVRTNSQLLRIPGGVGVDWVVDVQKGVYRLRDAFAPFNVPVQDRPAPDTIVSQYWRRSEDLSFTALTDAELRGATWYLRLVGPAPRDSVFPDGFEANDTVIMGALAQLNDDDARSVTLVEHGFSTPPTLTWGLTPGGGLELRYQDGMVQTFQQYARVNRELGLLVTFQRGSDIHVEYFRALPVDTQLTVTSTQAVTMAGQYWQTTINRSVSTPATGEDITAFEMFGFQFNRDGSATRVFPIDDDLTNLRMEDWWSFTLNGRDLQIDWQRSSANTLGCPDPNDMSCQLFRRRTWTPLALSNGWLYVLERSIWRPLDSRWDGQQWVDADGPLLEDQFDSFITHRLNAYFISNLP